MTHLAFFCHVTKSLFEPPQIFSHPLSAASHASWLHREQSPRDGHRQAQGLLQRPGHLHRFPRLLRPVLLWKRSQKWFWRWNRSILRIRHIFVCTKRPKDLVITGVVLLDTSWIYFWVTLRRWTSGLNLAADPVPVLAILLRASGSQSDSSFMRSWVRNHKILPSFGGPGSHILQKSAN